ncbi:MAG TPA: L-threonylcarbamoyladenylate synthase [Saprospiraceae bacterium]|nr:threonylcarbamoyl-AMP synthase [Saprospiraceae bacterium]HRO09163.1 L-threonylcarbamoyladenylate synthase [Saprospiraceae bacterium]HRO72411.1 L-threonylcarbamoyladenylate synthase [Saprospiraceae bacterium]HRP42629.1 L-threonylcarbamoyladenylate synthase [Saprospiraceae bacterium]
MQRVLFHEKNPNKRDLKEVADQINKGAIVVFPTDTIYALGCLMTNKAGIDRIIKILKKKEKHAKMSIICPNISVISQYTTQIDNDVFKTMKRYLPGPYTFILKSNNYVQKFFKNSKEEIGVRIPDNAILEGLQEFLDGPLISTSLNIEDGSIKVFNDPDEIEEAFSHQIDILMDGGLGDLTESTVLDCTDSEITVLREGKGVID